MQVKREFGCVASLVWYSHLKYVEKMEGQDAPETAGNGRDRIKRWPICLIIGHIS